MASKRINIFSLLLIAVVSFAAGGFLASAVSVCTKEGQTINRMIRLERKIVGVVEQGKAMPTAVDELVADGTCMENECQDAWGQRFELNLGEAGELYLVSLGDPAVRAICPGVEFTISRILPNGGSALLVDSPDVCHAVKESQSVHDVEVAIKSLMLASKRYDAMNVVDVFGDIYYRANKRLSENGLYGIGLHLVDTNTDVDTSSVTIDVPELTIFQAFEFVARRFGWAVEYNGGGVFVRGRHSEHLPEWRE